jgi:perosamine synthetase
MLRLIPTELYDYSMADLVHGLIAAARPALRLESIDLPSIGRGVPIRSARAGIVVALQALGLRPGSRIGVPLYCCPVVFKAVRAAGSVPRFLDIDPETYCLSADDLRAKASDIDAVIAVHMFGNLCDMTKVLEIAAGRPVIEDCAQSLGSRLNGRPAGVMGAVSVFSFRLGKYLSAGEGAALHTEQPDLEREIIQRTKALDSPSAADEFKHPLSAFLRSRLRKEPLWGFVGSTLWQAYNRRTDFMAKSPLVMSRMLRSDHENLRRRLGHLGHMIRAQRENAGFYQEHLKVEPSRLCIERPGAFYNRFMFPIIMDSPRERDLLIGYLKNKGVGAASPYEDVVEGAVTNYGYRGDCPEAERLLKTTLVIPCHHALSARDRAHIAASVNKGWSHTTPRGPALPLKRE